MGLAATATDAGRALLAHAEAACGFDLRRLLVEGGAALRRTAVYGNSLQLIANAVDWSLEDRALLAIRSRGHFNRTLPPLEEAQRTTLEYSNYAVALALLGLIFGIHRSRAKTRVAKYRAWLDGKSVDTSKGEPA